MFTDIDGTLTPPDEPGKPLKEALDALKELAKAMPVAVVTTKECAFAKQAVPFAAGYACINGVEILAGGYRAVADDLRPELLEGLADELEAAGAQLKRTSAGLLAGATIDWRGRAPPRGLEGLLAEAEARGLQVIRYRAHPLADLYASKRNKGDGVKALKALLGAKYVAYLGDSENDLPAWRLADVRIIVRHKYNAELKAEGLVPVPQADLAKYLADVAGSLRA